MRSILVSLAAAGLLGALTGNTQSGAQPVSQQNIELISPRNYQVFQRQSRAHGQMLVSGKLLAPCTRLEVRITGRSVQGILPGRWIEVPFSQRTGEFNSSMPISAGGWYRFQIKATIGVRVMSEEVVENVGVGEVFVGAGQSNSTNYGEEKQTPQSGMVSSFDGETWRLAADPQPGAHDKSTGGSFWPAFGDAVYERWHVPVGVAVTGHGGTSVNQWSPDSELFNFMMTRIYRLGRGGFRAVLWHQGESDTGMGTLTYVDKLTSIIKASTRDAGWQFPWMVAQVSYHNPNDASTPSLRDAFKRLWASGVAIEGPDTDTLTGDNRDSGGQGVHFSSKGLRAHGRLWAEKINEYLGGQLR